MDTMNTLIPGQILSNEFALAKSNKFLKIESTQISNGESIAFNLLSSPEFYGNAQVNIFDIQGRLIVSDQLMIDSENSLFNISCSIENSGIYFIQLISNNKQAGAKIMVQL